MPTAFDPYHRWLGIPSKDQPPDHYRLLGIDRFESDPEVIRDAAERQMGHVRHYALGQHRDVSQRILNELGAAKACLLAPEKKARYDAELRAATVASSAVEPPPVETVPELDPTSFVAPTEIGPAESGSPWRNGGKPVRGKAATKTSGLPIPPNVLLVLGVAAGVLVLIAVVWGVFDGGKKGGTKKERVATAKAPTGSSNLAPFEPKPTTPKVTPRPETKPEASREPEKQTKPENKREPPKAKREPVEPKPGLPRMSGPPPLAVAPFNSAEAKRHQEAWAKHLGVAVEFENSIGMRFVLIPPGEFDMGSTQAEIAKLLEEAKTRKDRSYTSEAPKHRVRITKPVWLSRHEVTRGQFRRFVDDRGYRTEAERDGRGGFGLVNGQFVQDPRFVWNRDPGFEQADDHPVVNVSWNDVTAFCGWLSENEGEKCQLPTEAQWEYACRAGTTTAWYSGDDEGALKEHAWFKDNAEGKTHPVGQKSPNAWGLYDMHGNVWEWCEDRFGGYYATSPLDDPTGAPRGTHRVFRGGSWHDVASLGRASYRNGTDPGGRDEFHGFRLARSAGCAEATASGQAKSGNKSPQSADRPPPREWLPLFNGKNTRVNGIDCGTHVDTLGRLSGSGGHICIENAGGLVEFRRIEIRTLAD